MWVEGESVGLAMAEVSALGIGGFWVWAVAGFSIWVIERGRIRGRGVGVDWVRGWGVGFGLVRL